MKNYGIEKDKSPKFQRWTQSAVECYLIGCTCSKCYLYPILKNKCKMKQSVIELVRQFGKPKVSNEGR